MVMACVVALPAALALAATPSARLVAHFALSAVPAEPGEVACSSRCEAPGLLTVDTQPWTRVVVDGQVRGTTPLWKIRLLPGAHTISFSNEDASINHQEVVLVQSATAHRLKGRFTTAESLATVPLPTQKAEGDSRDECCGDLVSPAFLTVNAQPWAFVYVDGRRVGTTPLFRVRLAAGPRHVVLMNEAQEITFDQVLTLERDAERKLDAHQGP
jgi:hypothetical protein